MLYSIRTTTTSWRITVDFYLGLNVISSNAAEAVTITSCTPLRTRYNTTIDSVLKLENLEKITEKTQVCITYSELL